MQLMDFILTILQKNKTKIKILFPEGENEKIQKVALQITAADSPIKEFIEPVLLFNTNEEIPTTLKNITTKVMNEAELSAFSNELFELRKDKGLTSEQANTFMSGKNFYGMMILKKGEVAGLVGGINYTTADILRPALQIIGPKSGVKTVSSAFIMNKNDEVFLFSDASINLDPKAEALVDISKSAVEFAELLKFNPIKLALLSYSTNGSGSGASVEKVQTAVKIIKDLKLKNTQIAGEIQFDAAWDEEIRKKKFKDLKISGSCNVFIFPDLNAANIGYKIAQRLGNYKAIGPVVLGLKQPVNDLSRGATVDDIYYTALITAVQTLIKK